ncbi:MAG: hypothetical protein GYA21_14900 [Myxococcales bacterium]|nr:hypothetical protein [Myxococcales bacterium]
MSDGTSCGEDKRAAVGAMQAAVEAHHAGAAVIFEAASLDRELGSARPDWPAILRAGTTFAQHYPAVLLYSPDALVSLGSAYLTGACRATSPDLRERFALALFSLLDAVLEEARRAEPRLVPHLPGLCIRLLRELGSCQESLLDPGRLIEPLNLLGRRILRMADERQPTEEWFELLGRVTDLLLANTRERLRGEPVYDGRWDALPERLRLHVGLLEPVRRERLEQDLRWLDALSRAGTRTPARTVEMFLELSSYQRRGRRAGAWDQWLRSVAAEAAGADFPARLLLELCRTIAEWLERVRDRHFLSRIAESLGVLAPDILRRQEAGGWQAFFSTVGRAIARRLETEAGRGEIDEGLRGLCTLLHRAVRQAPIADSRVRAEVVDLSLRAHLGPVIGRPLAFEDLLEVLAFGLAHPGHAGPILRRAVVGLRLEECLFVQEEAQTRRRGELLSSLAALLSTPWEPGLRHTVRALLRLVPLSPYHLGEPGVRAQLLALEPTLRPDSFLSDLRRAVLERPLPQARRAVEQVLRFLQSADASALDGLATPESVFALPRLSEELRLSDVRSLLRSLSRIVPGGSETSVTWLAELPEVYGDPRTLSKLAGFEGCAPIALEKLSRLLGLYRTLRPRHAANAKVAAGAQPDLARAARLLEARREIGQTFFQGAPPPSTPAPERLDALAQDLELQHELQDCLSVWRGLPLCRENLDPLQKVLALLLDSALLSGLGNAETQAVAAAWPDAPHVDRPKLLRRMLGGFTGLRNQAAADFLPHVEDSLHRLRTNPLARPSESWREFFVSLEREPLSEAAARLGDALCEDLYGADGALPEILELVQRLSHLWDML